MQGQALHVGRALQRQRRQRQLTAPAQPPRLAATGAQPRRQLQRHRPPAVQLELAQAQRQLRQLGLHRAVRHRGVVPAEHAVGQRQLIERQLPGRRRGGGRGRVGRQRLAQPALDHPAPVGLARQPRQRRAQTEPRHAHGARRPVQVQPLQLDPLGRHQASVVGQRTAPAPARRCRRGVGVGQGQLAQRHLFGAECELRRRPGLLGRGPVQRQPGRQLAVQARLQHAGQVGRAQGQRQAIDARLQLSLPARGLALEGQGRRALAGVRRTGQLGRALPVQRLVRRPGQLARGQLQALQLQARGRRAVRAGRGVAEVQRATLQRQPPDRQPPAVGRPCGASRGAPRCRVGWAFRARRMCASSY